MSDVIELRGLVKRFGRVQALDRLDLSVPPGQVHGFLGPNGAGKSTTIRIVLGLLRADSGEASVLGADPWTAAAELHRHIAYVPGDVTLWPTLSGGEVIDLLVRLNGAGSRQCRSALIERFELDPSKQCRSYSKGNRQKVGLVAALIADAELYIFDEPTSGLDPIMESRFRDCVRELNAAGRTILLSSHVLSEVEALCDSVTIIRRGRTVETGTLADMRHLSVTTVDVQTTMPLNLTAVTGVRNLEVDGTRTTFHVDTDHLHQVLERLAVADVQSLVMRPPSLEEMFLQLYGDEPVPAARADG